MSEKEPLNLRPAEIAQALGTDQAVYIGQIGIHDIISGNAAQLARQASEAIANEPNPLLRAVQKLTACAESSDEDYTDAQRQTIVNARDVVLDANTRVESGESPYQVCSDLYDLYWQCQQALTDTTPGHILRLVGDDLVIDKGLDVDHTWWLFEQALERFERQTGL